MEQVIQGNAMLCWLSPASCAQTLGHGNHNEVPEGSMQWLYLSREHLKKHQRVGALFIHTNVHAESAWRHSGTNSARHRSVRHTLVQEINIFDSCQRRGAERYCLFFLCPPSTKRYQQPREDRGRLTSRHILIDGCHRYRIWPAACSSSTLLHTTLSLLCITDPFFSLCACCKKLWRHNIWSHGRILLLSTQCTLSAAAGRNEAKTHFLVYWPMMEMNYASFCSTGSPRNPPSRLPENRGGFPVMRM